MPGALWKDLHVLGEQPTLRPFEDAASAAAALPLSDLRIASGRTPPRRIERAGVQVIEAIVEFRMPSGHGEGVIRLDDAGPPARAREITTVLRGWDGAPERIGHRRPGHADDGRHRFDAPTWYEERTRRARFDDRDPEVLIVGGGQAGLSLAARLGRMGVDALVIERSARVGDTWRHRYRALHLHNAAPVIGLPYFPIPLSWETFLSKDRIANWLEYYVDAMDIACWTSTELESAHAVDDGWVATVAGPGGRREIRASHLVLATGVSGAPRMPRITGLEEFGGEVIHSAGFGSGESYRGRRALVIGAGSSGHDIAQDLHDHGAAVTMLQRGPTTVSSIRSIWRILDAAYGELDQHEVDLLGASYPLPTFLRLQRDVARRLGEADADLLSGLAAAGFATDFGPDGTGPVLRYWRQGGGFYLDVGCAGLIASGAIPVVQAERVARFEADGLRLDDGTVLGFDLVVAATGYEPQSRAVADWLGADVAERIGPVWGLDDEGFARNVWRPTAVEGLWFMLGNFQQCRFYSRVLAVQLAARLRSATGTSTRPHSIDAG